MLNSRPKTAKRKKNPTPFLVLSRCRNCVIPKKDNRPIEKHVFATIFKTVDAG